MWLLVIRKPGGGGNSVVMVCGTVVLWYCGRQCVLSWPRVVAVVVVVVVGTRHQSLYRQSSVGQGQWRGADSAATTTTYTAVNTT